MIFAGNSEGGERVKRRSVKWFLLAQLAAYLCFLYMDLFRGGAGSAPVKYAAIALCVLFSLYGAAQGGEWLVTAALALTLGADTFLLLLDTRYLTGVLLFCAVQGLYLIRVLKANGGHALWLLRLGLLIGALCLLRWLESFSPLNVAAVFYFTAFLMNTVQSLSLGGKRLRLFSLGLVLFLCCDLCVGAFQAPGLVPGGVYSFTRVGMWLFYLPAQVLITLSGLPDSVLRGIDHEDQ